MKMPAIEGEVIKRIFEENSRFFYRGYERQSIKEGKLPSDEEFTACE